MGWVSPTGFVDSGGQWTNEAKAYDGIAEIGNYAKHTPDTTGWTSFLELTHAALDCNKVRFWIQSNQQAAQQGIIDLDVYYNDDWHDIYSGDYAAQAWVEKNLDATYSVTALRVRFNPTVASITLPILGEAAFWEVPPAVGRSFGFIMG